MYDQTDKEYTCDLLYSVCIISWGRKLILILREVKGTLRFKWLTLQVLKTINQPLGGGIVCCFRMLWMHDGGPSP